MSLEQKEEIEEMINTNDKIFLGFLVLKELCLTKRKKIRKEDLAFVYENYSFLLVERKNYLETEKKLVSLNNFYGLR